MFSGGRVRLIASVIALTLWVAILAAGIVRSVYDDGKLPAVNVFSNGSAHYIQSLIADENYDGAIEQLQLDLVMRPHETLLLETLGNLLGSRRRPLEARECFRQLVERRPDDAEAHRLLGCTYLDTQQPNLAVPHLQKAIELKPDFPMALNNLGLALAQLGQIAAAEKRFAKAVELAPEMADAVRNLELARRHLEQQP